MDSPFSDKVPKLSVSELTTLIKTTLETSFYGLTVEGEISGFRPASTGHWYFSLKDQSAVISCCMWRSSIPRVPFRPKDGMRVIVTGSISVFEPRGTYQIICTSMRVAGEGDILAMLEERKRKYDALGYFDPAVKKPIPVRPSRVAVITSPTGAALQDILQITGRRNKGMDIIILPAVVQGADAAPTIAARIREVNEFLLADVMIVGRGGGSIEDLLPFSEECVIEAIHESAIPVISAVGHEIDWAISDYVADLRAPTPSAAAELVCQSSLDQIEKVNQLRSSMYDALIGRLNTIKLRIAAFSPAAARAQLESRLNRVRMTLDSDTVSLSHRMESLISARKSKAELLRHKIMALSPLSVLERGYSITSDSQGRTVRSASQVSCGDKLTLTLKDGKITTIAQEVTHG
ncbi:MAG: exodeoxyribonuclease VII large subunit [Sphaerochaetaceae bacterium]|nr:exodeoxyribonuclease VII large subunit [Sphaerochaetaceae bacterium]